MKLKGESNSLATTNDSAQYEVEYDRVGNGFEEDLTAKSTNLKEYFHKVETDTIGRVFAIKMKPGDSVDKGDTIVTVWAL